MDRYELSFETLKAWCVREKFEFSENVAAGQLAIHYKLLGEMTALMILPQPERGMVMFAIPQPFRVPKARYAAIVEATAQLNAISFMGAWVLNPQSGELMFRASVVTLDVGYTDAGLLHVSRIVVTTAERAAPALKAIAMEGADPAQAIAALSTAS